MPGLYIGLMSGTSMDGIDAALIAMDVAPVLLQHVHHPLPPQLRETLLALNVPGNDELHRAALAANALALSCAAAVNALLAQSRQTVTQVTAIGCHGQTVRHNPAAGYTLQLVNGALLAELTGVSVVCDFRGRDIAAGGEGAPLVPAFHRIVFACPGIARAVVNIGGIANVTWMPVDDQATGFDCGPGNVLMDGWIAQRKQCAYDKDGAWARQGRVLPELLGRLLAHDFFHRPPPKSTGRDLFNLHWVQQALTGNERPEDVQATLLELTAQGITCALEAHCADVTEIYLCGGGARNTALRERLAALLPKSRIDTTESLGWAVDTVEAAAFAWLAAQALARQPGNLPQVTGACGPRILGAIYPA